MASERALFIVLYELFLPFFCLPPSEPALGRGLVDRDRPIAHADRLHVLGAFEEARGEVEQARETKLLRLFLRRLGVGGGGGGELGGGGLGVWGLGVRGGGLG